MVLSKDGSYIVLLFYTVTVNGKSDFKALQQQLLTTNTRMVPPPPSSVWRDQTAPQCLGSLGAAAEHLRGSSGPLLKRVLGQRAVSPSSAASSSLQECVCVREEVAIRYS